MNLVRAQFCVERQLKTSDVLSWLRELETLGCSYSISRGKNTLIDELATALSSARYMSTDLLWSVDERTYLGYLSKMTWDVADHMRISFDIDADIFLSEQLLYRPQSDGRFDAFKRIVVEIIKQFNPILGVIDYEADLLCDPPIKYGSLVSWSNYFSQTILKQWSVDSLLRLKEVVDEYVQVDNLGVLTFIHPLGVNQIWTWRHNRLEELLRSNGLAEE